MSKVSIFRDGVWVGDGYWMYGIIRDCSAVLGADQDASEETCELLEDALAALDGPGGEVRVERPDGTYTAVLSE